MDSNVARPAPTLPSRRALGYLCSLLAGAALLSACSPSDDDPGGNGGDANLLLTDANNYSSQTTFTITTAPTVVGDVNICWAGVTQDVLCHDIQPATAIDNVSVVRFKGQTKEQLEGTFASSQLQVSDVDGYFSFDNTAHTTTCARLSEMKELGATTTLDVPSKYLAGAEYLYLLTVTKGTKPGVGAQSMLYLSPSTDSSVSEVQMPPGCNVLDFQAQLSAVKLSVPAAGPWVLDWDDMTTDGAGSPLNFGGIDRALIGFYAGMDVATFEGQLKDWEINATNLWEIAANPGIATLDLAGAVETKTQAPFTGFDTTAPGLWIVGLMCSNCQSPAPLVLAVLEPTA